jgi:hypothetical protein
VSLHPQDGWGLPPEYLALARELSAAYLLLEGAELKVVVRAAGGAHIP